MRKSAPSTYLLMPVAPVKSFVSNAKARIAKADYRKIVGTIMVGAALGLVGCGEYFDPAAMSNAKSAEQRATTRVLLPGEFDVATNYEDQCLGCHGLGTEFPDTQLVKEEWGTTEALTSVIENHTVLEDGSEIECAGECAQTTAQYMLDTLNLPILYVNAGRTLYIQECAACHGAEGEGGAGGPLSLDTCQSCDTLEALIARTTNTMPTQNPSECVGSCADATSRYIKAGFQEVSAEPEQPPSDDNTGADDPMDDQMVPPGVDPMSMGTLTCDEAGKATVFEETVYANVIAPKCALCHTSAIANQSLFMMSNVAEENFPAFVTVADPMYDFNGEPLPLARAVNEGGAHDGGQIFPRDSVDYTALETMIDALDAEVGACEAPFQSLYEAFGLPFPRML